jgi:hypothetical protein
MLNISKYFRLEIHGNYQHISSIFAFRLLFINMSTESPFFTFTSKKKKYLKIYLTYFSWQFLQILFVLLLNQDIYQLLFQNIEIYLVFSALGVSIFTGNIQNNSNHLIDSSSLVYFL